MEHFFRKKLAVGAEDSARGAGKLAVGAEDSARSAGKLALGVGNPSENVDLPELSTKSGVIERFLGTIFREIREKAPYFSEKSVNTVYFGGGTPSFLDSNDIKRIFDEVKRNFLLEKEGFEATIELNPGTLSTQKLSNYLNWGISRASIGFQSLDDDVLKTLGRIHNRDQAIDAYKMAREAGFKNISVDLMFAIPGQSMAVWEDTVKRAIDLGPEHISLYSLEFMEGTRFDAMRKAGKLIETDAELDRDMYERALDLMEEAGYHQYEISNCAKPGFESKHNMKYWDLSEYVGFGPSAHSYYSVKKSDKSCNARFKNPSNLEEYINNPLGSECYSENSFQDDITEYTFTGLRKAEGIDKNRFYAKFGEDIWDFYGDFIHKEFLAFASAGFAVETPERINLTRKGFSISNRIMELFV